MSWAQLWPILVDYQKSIIWFTLCLITEFNFCTVAFCAETNFNAVTHRLGPPQGTGEKLEQRQGFPQVVAHKAPVEERWVIVQLLEWVLTVGMLKTKKFGVNWINIWYLWPLAMPKGCNHVPSFLFAPFFFSCIHTTLAHGERCSLWHCASIAIMVWIQRSDEAPVFSVLEF